MLLGFPRCASPNQTVPTGFSSVPPSGPAIPVMATVRVVATIMGASAVIGTCVGFTAGLPYLVVVAALAVYAVTITGESASVTTGTVLAAPPERKGAAMALHSLLGFAFAFLGALAPGVALDLAGGTESQFAWTLAFLTMAAGAAMGPILVLTLARGSVRVQG